ncbi:hypothetical protein BC938DRAFT_473557 [Jimgerdemannia flammicorona]|uniref:Uncharacterized protein n=1 Tax=Jimgerdemannia flammicorona TaxID=994334 RepID=A0A433QT82_9FUNG|nr:hypothetical protein BC938DRAFT_473557 [Jimgerdemannia flammicorona]
MYFVFPLRTWGKNPHLLTGKNPGGMMHKAHAQTLWVIGLEARYQELDVLHIYASKRKVSHVEDNAGRLDGLVNE